MTAARRLVTTEEFDSSADAILAAAHDGDEILVTDASGALGVVHRVPSREEALAALRGTVSVHCTDDQLVYFNAEDDWDALT